MPAATTSRSMRMSKNNQIMPWHGIPREEIEWHPTVVDERCIGCGKYDVKQRQPEVG